jgi:hypothetical protein
MLTKDLQKQAVLSSIIEGKLTLESAYKLKLIDLKELSELSALKACKML